MAKKLKPVLDVKVTVEVGGLTVYEGKSAIEIQVGLDQLPDQVLHSTVAVGVTKLIPAIRVQSLYKFRALLRGAIVDAFPDDHSQHGRGTPDGPHDSDCGCRGTEKEATCAKAGCGFCVVARGAR